MDDGPEFDALLADSLAAVQMLAPPSTSGSNSASPDSSRGDDDEVAASVERKLKGFLERQAQSANVTKPSDQPSEGEQQPSGLVAQRTQQWEAINEGASKSGQQKPLHRTMPAPSSGEKLQRDPTPPPGPNSSAAKSASAYQKARKELTEASKGSKPRSRTPSPLVKQPRAGSTPDPKIAHISRPLLMSREAQQREYVPPVFKSPPKDEAIQRIFKQEVPRAIAQAADIERLSEWWDTKEAESYPASWESGEWIEPNIAKLRDEGVSNSIVSVFEKMREKQMVLEQQTSILGSPIKYDEISPKRKKTPSPHRLRLTSGIVDESSKSKKKIYEPTWLENTQRKVASRTSPPNKPPSRQAKISPITSRSPTPPATPTASSPTEARVSSKPRSPRMPPPLSEAELAQRARIEAAWNELASGVTGIQLSLDRGTYGKFKCKVERAESVQQGVLISFRVDGDTEFVPLSTVAEGIQNADLKERALALEEAWKHPDQPFDPSVPSPAPAAVTWTEDSTEPAEPQQAPIPSSQPATSLPISTSVEKLPATGTLEKLEFIFEKLAGDADTVSESAMFEFGLARRELGHKTGSWSEAANQKIIKKMGATFGENFVTRSNFLSYFLSLLPKGALDVGQRLAELEECASLAATKIQSSEGKTSNVVNAPRSLDDASNKVDVADKMSAQFKNEMRELSEKLRSAGLEDEADALRKLPQAASDCSSFAGNLRAIYVPIRELSFPEQSKALASRKKPKRVAASVVNVVKQVAADLTLIGSRL